MGRKLIRVGRQVVKRWDDLRISPKVGITLLPLVLAEGKRQAKARGVSFSRHLSDLIEARSVEDGRCNTR